MRCYLIDTNIASYLFDKKKPEHGAVKDRFEALAGSANLAISAISLGEIEYGHFVDGSEQTQLFRSSVAERFTWVVPVDVHTRTHYGELRAKLYERSGLGKGKSKERRNKRPEELLDPTTAKALGVQENDLWLAAQALQHNFILVTHDKMRCLREVATDLSIEDWAKPAPPAASH